MISYDLNWCGIYIPVELNDHYSIVSDNLYSKISSERKERNCRSIYFSTIHLRNQVQGVTFKFLQMCERLYNSIDLYFDDAMHTFVCYTKKKDIKLSLQICNDIACIQLLFHTFIFFPPNIRYIIKKKEKLHFFLQETIESLYIYINM